MFENKYLKTLLISVIVTIFFSTSISAQMSGGDFEVYTDKFSVVSTQSVSGGAYDITQTAGQYFATTTSEGDFEVRSGFQAQEKGILKVNLSSNSVTLGELTTSNVASDSINVEVTTDSETGYNLSIRENSGLSASGDIISDVADNSVSAGSEEYGITTSGGDSLLSQDKPITGTSLNIASHDGQVYKRSTEITFKASLGSEPSQDRNYSHQVFFNVTVNP